MVKRRRPWKPSDKTSEKASKSRAAPNAGASRTKTLLSKTSPNKASPKETKQMSPEPTSKATAPAPASERQPAQIRYLDRADMEETFADSITGLIFDGQTLRIEFGVTRFDDVKPNSPISGRRYPACRLVLPPAAAVDLINRMQQIAAALKQAGVVRTRDAAEPAKAG
jgi:hypothetical protein